jgi:hypothetical protein
MVFPQFGNFVFVTIVFSLLASFTLLLVLLYFGGPVGSQCSFSWPFLLHRLPFCGGNGRTSSSDPHSDHFRLEELSATGDDDDQPLSSPSPSASPEPEANHDPGHQL